MTYYGNQDFVSELNRLANGGTYPARTAYLDAPGAANKWAGTTGWNLVAALNIKAGNSQPNWRGLAAVCNQLAGTVGFDPQGALQQASGVAGGGATTFNQAVATTAPRAYWNLQETSGTTAVDSSPSPVASGTYVGSPTLNQGSLVPTDATDRSIITDGATQYVTVDAGRVGSITSDWSYGFVFKAGPGASAAATEVLYSEGTTAGSSPALQFATSVNGSFNKMRVRMQNDAAATVFDQDSTGLFFDNNAHFVLVTLTGTSLRWYLDGSVDRTVTITPAGTFTPTIATIGAYRRNTTANYFSGQIGAVITWNRGLSGAEATALGTAFTG